MPDNARRTNDTYAVMLVGGKGKRLRPLSTDSRPKAFLSVTRDRKTMFRRAVERMAGLVNPENMLIAANKKNLQLVKKDLPRLKNGNIILESVSRNTAPAIALAAHKLRRRGLDPIMVVTPADQYIIETAKYLESIKKGIKFVRKNIDTVVILGARPTYPATGYGYVKLDVKNKKPKTIMKVEKFVEKPDIGSAREYIANGNYLWNTGLFIFRSSTILSLIKRFKPEIYYGITGRCSFSKLPDISIDYAVMEKSDNIYCVEGDYKWRDMGDFEGIMAVMNMEGRPFVSRAGKVVKII